MRPCASGSRLTSFLLLADSLSFLLAGLIWLHLRYGFIELAAYSPVQWQEIIGTSLAYAISVFIMLAVLATRHRHYSQRAPFWDELFQLAGVALLGLGLQAMLFYALHIQPSRVDFALQWISLLFLLPAMRHGLRQVLMRSGYWQIPVTLIGAGDNAREAWQALCSEPQMGFMLVGVIVPEGQPDPAWVNSRQVVCHHAVDWKHLDPRAQFVIALEEGQQDLQDEFMRQIARHARDIMVAPPVGRLPTLSLRPMHFMAHEALILSSRNLLNQVFVRACKRAMDIVCALSLILLLSPLLLSLMAMVAASGRPIFFAHERIGRDGRTFPCYKFRTMVPNAAEVLRKLLDTDRQARAEWDREFKLRDDPRITLTGRFLRRTSLDELPQLWNVLRGDMSLVGPRPVIAEELARYGEDVCYYTQVRPGMTGLWQVSGRNNIDYAARVSLDAWYVRNWSLGTDIAILFKTLAVVVRGHGAY